MSPDKRSAPDGHRGTSQNTLATAGFNPKRIAPPDLVRNADINALVMALGSVDPYDPFAIVECDGTIWFRCPRNHHFIRSNMGPARVVDHWRWTCDNCRADGTRFELERLILESSKAVEALQQIVADRLAVAA